MTQLFPPRRRQLSQAANCGAEAQPTLTLFAPRLSSASSGMSVGFYLVEEQIKTLSGWELIARIAPSG